MFNFIDWDEYKKTWYKPMELSNHIDATNCVNDKIKEQVTMGIDEVDQYWRCKEERDQEINSYKYTNNLLQEQLEKQEQISKWLAEKLESAIKNMHICSANEWLKIAEQAIIINSKNFRSK